MIKANGWRVEIEGKEAAVAGEIMCVIGAFVEEILMPKCGGSKENARGKISKMIDIVFEEISGCDR